MTEDHSSTFNRRTVLKSAPAVAGLGLSGKVTAKEHGTVQFSELRLIHDVSIPDDDLTYPFNHVDEFGHALAVDKEASTLYINERYAQEHLTRARESKSVVGGIEFAALPTAFGDRAYGTPVTNLIDDYRATQEISVSGYRRPSISVSQKRDELVVETAGTRTTIRPGSESRTALANQEVSVDAYRAVEQDPDDITLMGGEEHHHPSRVPKKREYETKTITITPKIAARNYGELDVVGIRATGPNYSPSE